MNTYISLHPSSDTRLCTTRNTGDCGPFHTLDIGPDVSVFFTNPEMARRMAELLLQIARELEDQEDAS